MCGIFGIFHQNGQPVAVEMLQRAANILRHRGPDDEGYLLVNTSSGRLVPCGGADTIPALNMRPVDSYQGEIFNLAFAFRRLAVLDLSPTGHQPMSSRDGALWIVFNGEIYNYLELRDELKRKGYNFQTQTDTEVILAAYTEWGEACLDRFNGMWAFALWDNRHKSLFMARDPFGIKPLHYTHEDGEFVFASEIKALVGKQGVPFQPDDESVYRYLVGGNLPSPRQGKTFFKKVYSLPAGHCMKLDGNTDPFQPKRYWFLPESSDDCALSSANVVSGYRQLLFDAIRLQLHSDVPIGTCLSGGVDSSSIVCIVNRIMKEGGISAVQIGDRQKTFSAVYEEIARYNEREYIEKVIEATHAEPNFVLPNFQRLQDELERVVWHQEEPFASTSIFAQWCVMSKARERGVTVLLDGQGADEGLAGYRPFAIFLVDIFHSQGLLPAWQEAKAIQAVTHLKYYSLLGEALIRQLPSKLTKYLRRYQAWRRMDFSLLQPDFVDRFHHQTPADWDSWEEHATLNQHLRTIIEDNILPQLLRYEDRNSMAFGIEARVPYLDRRLVEFSFKSAARWRIYQGWTKWVLRQAMDGIVPPEVLWRRDKVAFETPEREWLRHWLRRRMDIFESGCFSRDYLETDAMRKRIGQWFKVGKEPGPIWRWINLEMWLRCAKRF